MSQLQIKQEETGKNQINSNIIIEIVNYNYQNNYI